MLVKFLLVLDPSYGFMIISHGYVQYICCTYVHKYHRTAVHVCLSAAGSVSDLFLRSSRISQCMELHPNSTELHQDGPIVIFSSDVLKKKAPPTPATHKALMDSLCNPITPEALR